jgi:hypothetical protein
VAGQASRASEYQTAQRGLIVVLIRDLRKLWPRLDPHRLRKTIPPWTRASHAVVARYARMSAGLAGDYYDAERVFAKVTGKFTVPFPDPPPLEQVEEALRWATKGLWDPPAGSGRSVAPLEQRVKSAQELAQAASSKIVTDAGRATILGAVTEDRVATAWARQARPDACAFCKLLAARGVVYAADSVDFQAHNGCSCTVVPLFEGQKWEPTADVRQWQALYEKASRMRGDTISNFRKVIAAAG